MLCDIASFSEQKMANFFPSRVVGKCVLHIKSNHAYHS